MSDATPPAARDESEVYPMSGDELRLMSAWAGEMPNENLVFVYGPDAVLTRMDPAVPVSAADVLVPSWTGARPGRLSAIEFAVGGYDPACFSAREWTAAFWSESSVEKFVVPYLAALTGGAAAGVLARVMTAWNRWPDDQPVLGLLLRGWTKEGASLAVGELVDVLYLDLSVAGGELRVSPLEEFLAGIDPIRVPPPPPREQVAYVRGPVTAALPRYPSQFDLRRMAEWANSLREKPMYFLFDVIDGSWSAPVATLPEDLSNRVVIPAYTPPTRRVRPTPSRVTLHLDEGVCKELCGRKVDSAFWGTAAVDLVLMPYYARAYGVRALGELAHIDSVWMGLSTTAGPGADPDTEEPAAIIHFPKSDWEPTDLLASALPLTHELGVVSASRSAPGGARVVPLPEFPGRRG